MESALNTFHKKRQVYVIITCMCPMFLSSHNNFQTNWQIFIRLVVDIVQLPLNCYILSITPHLHFWGTNKINLKCNMMNDLQSLCSFSFCRGGLKTLCQICKIYIQFFINCNDKRFRLDNLNWVDRSHTCIF
jgi:hypothetical protein